MVVFLMEPSVLEAAHFFVIEIKNSSELLISKVFAFGVYFNFRGSIFRVLKCEVMHLFSFQLDVFLLFY